VSEARANQPAQAYVHGQRVHAVVVAAQRGEGRVHAAQVIRAHTPVRRARHQQVLLHLDAPHGAVLAHLREEPGAVQWRLEQKESGAVRDS
jgi:hypothetical protein